MWRRLRAAASGTTIKIAKHAIDNGTRSRRLALLAKRYSGNVRNSWRCGTFKVVAEFLCQAGLAQFDRECLFDKHGALDRGAVG